MNKPQTLLHVEDDEALVFLFRRVLEKEGFNYQCVSNVDDAIAYIAKQGHFSDAAQYPQPDVILTDLTLASGRSAAEFIVWLRHHPQHQHTPIVVLTGGADTAMEERVMRAGANAFVMKGIAMNELVDQLRAAFREAGVM
jgi:DNA-binding response OmpR family regulator